MQVGPRSPSTPGVEVGAGTCITADSPDGNPNLLLWSEEFDRAGTWTASNFGITANTGPDPDGVEVTADTAAWLGASAALSQITPQAATSGAQAAATVGITATWERFSVTGTFDGQPFTFSVYLKAGAEGTGNVRLVLDRSGGFLRVAIADALPAADEIGFVADWAKLEQAAEPSGYIKREGT